MTDVNLGNKGTLWTWTVQRLMPKPPYRTDETPETFSPFGVGYLEMASGVRVESRLLFDNESDLEIGAEMMLVLIPVRTNDDGKIVVTFAFAPNNLGGGIV